MYFSTRYRPNKWPFYAFVLLEGPFTVAILALFGIASPDLYRTKLWQDGSDNGFNSNPNAALYAAANYRPYTPPKVWSPFITNYDLVISVLSVFILLCKTVMYILHVFPPLVNVLTHTLLIALFTVSITYQAGSDMTDPQHPQPGPPWYITKSCSVAYNPNNIHYCIQAKASFACVCVMLGIFVMYFVHALWSCFPSKSYKAELDEKKAIQQQRKDRWTEIEAQNLPQEPKTPKTAFDLATPVPRTPGSTVGIKSPMNPMTPRTLAFNRLGGTKDLPLRNHFSTPNAPKSPTHASYALQSPDFPRSPMSTGFSAAMARADEDGGDDKQQMYFPPPPKVATRS